MKARIEYGRWVLNVIGWDGLLPAAVVIAPMGIELVFPNSRLAIEIAALILPIVAFCVRAAVGHRHISNNFCGVLLRCLQYLVFGLACFMLVVVDAILVLSHVMPQGALFAAEEDRMVWTVLISLYLLAMTIAMYPGRERLDMDHDQPIRELMA